MRCWACHVLDRLVGPDEGDLSLPVFLLWRHFRTPCGGWSRYFRRAARALLLCLRFDDHRALRVRIETQLRELHRVRDQRLDLRAVEVRNRVQLDVTHRLALTLQQLVRVRLRQLSALPKSQLHET